MKASALPTKIQIPFGSGANAASYMRTVPVPSQQGITNGAASFTDGFPPVCFQPIGSGGVPPAGQDFQYLLNLVTSWNRWQSAGGLVSYDAAFSAAIGGYPKGAILASATGQIIWLNSVDDNQTNPDSNSAANWVKIYSAVAPVVGGRILFTRATSGTYSWTVPNDGTTVVNITAVGGGGGGGGGNGYAGAGGLGGNYFQGVFNVVPGSTYTVVVGAGGAAGGGGGGGAPGGNGGSTYIQLATSTPVALGGTGGGSGGNSNTNYVGITGNSPGYSGIVFPYGGFEVLGYAASNGIYLTNPTLAITGIGGGSYLASSTPLGVTNGSFNGSGSGGGASGGAGPAMGGQGAPGAIFIEG